MAEGLIVISEERGGESDGNEGQLWETWWKEGC